ncbi:MAG: hypothetical protein AAF297_03725 [Planctomycetota bacterium]
MGARQRVRRWLRGSYPGLWSRLDGLYLSSLGRLRGAGAVRVLVRAEDDAGVRAARAQSYRPIEIEVGGAAVEEGLTVFVPKGARLDRHAVWRRVRAYEEAAGTQPGVVTWLCGAWSDLDEDGAVGPALTPGLASVGDVYAIGGWLAGVTPECWRPDVLFVPHNAYHAGEMARVAEELTRRGRRVLFCDITDAYLDEGSRARMAELGVPRTVYTDDVLRRVRPRSVFVMNDWSGVAHDLVVDARGLGIRTLALVEGVQDYEDTHVEHIGVGTKRRPYQHAELALLVGEFDRRFFDGREVEVTGSTRIEALALEPRPSERRRRVVINSNFTYGIYTEQQPAWLAAAARACREVGVEFVVSRHHADGGDFSAYPLSDRPLYDELREAAVVVSRFSGVLLEAMALDTPVVYFNPHGERVATFREPDGAFPVAADAAGLAAALREVLDTPVAEIAERQRAFFATRVSIDADRRSWERIADAVERSIGAGRPERE